MQRREKREKRKEKREWQDPGGGDEAARS